MILLVPLIIALIVIGKSEPEDRAYCYAVAACLSAAALLGVVLA